MIIRMFDKFISKSCGIVTLLRTTYKRSCQDGCPYIDDCCTPKPRVLLCSFTKRAALEELFRGRSQRLLRIQSDSGSLLWCEERRDEDKEDHGRGNRALSGPWTRHVPVSSFRSTVYWVSHSTLILLYMFLMWYDMKPRKWLMQRFAKTCLLRVFCHSEVDHD